MLTEIWIEIQSFNVFLEGTDKFFLLLFSPLMISLTNDQFDQLKLEKKHKKAVAREDEYAKVNVESTARSVASTLSYPLRARPIFLRRSPRAPNIIWSAPVYFIFRA